jgi:hypothetical protein
MSRRTLEQEREEEARADTQAVVQVRPPESDGIIAMQQGAGNAAVTRMIASGGGRPVVARWKNLGTESYKIPGFGGRNCTLWTGTKEEWSSRLDNIDDDDEYEEDLMGFLQVSNDPGLVGRTAPPPGIANKPEDVGYKNTFNRAPTEAEKLAFLEALYEKAGGLDLWHGSVWEGGPWLAYADKDLARFIQNNQGLYLAAMGRKGSPLDKSGVKAVAEQGGKAATMAMIVNAGATAHKGVDLVMTANRKEGQEKETLKSQAMQTIRNAAQTIQLALKVNDDRVAFEQAVIGEVFDHVWGLIPGGGALLDAGKAALKFGLKEALKKASEDDGPGAQDEAITKEFVVTVNGLVPSGLIDAGDATDAILSFQSAQR